MIFVFHYWVWYISFYFYIELNSFSFSLSLTLFLSLFINNLVLFYEKYSYEYTLGAIFLRIYLLRQNEKCFPLKIKIKKKRRNKKKMDLKNLRALIHWKIILKMKTSYKLLSI